MKIQIEHAQWRTPKRFSREMSDIIFKYNDISHNQLLVSALERANRGFVITESGFEKKDKITGCFFFTRH